MGALNSAKPIADGGAFNLHQEGLRAGARDGQYNPIKIIVLGHGHAPNAITKPLEKTMENKKHRRPKRKLPRFNPSPPECPYELALRQALWARDDAERRIAEIGSRRRNYSSSQPGQPPDITEWLSHAEELNQAYDARDRARSAIEFFETRLKIQEDYGAI